MYETTLGKAAGYLRLGQIIYYSNHYHKQLKLSVGENGKKTKITTNFELPLFKKIIDSGHMMVYLFITTNNKLC